MNRARFLGGLVLALLILAGAVLLFRPVDMPPPGPGNAPAAAASASPGKPVSFTDALGVQINLPRPASRVISMAPNLAEIVCAIGAGGQLVGVDNFTKYPPEAAAKPKIGGITNPDLEKLMALQPDLLLVARGIDKERIAKLRELACPVATFDPQSLAQVLTVYQQVGQLTGHADEAGQRVVVLRQRLEKVRARAKTLPGPRPRVLLVIAWDGLYVGGTGGFANDLITTAGGVNAVALMKGISPDAPWPVVTRELVVVSDPQVIVFAGNSATPSGQDLPHTLQTLRADAAWASLSAVKNGRVYLLPEDPLTIPGPRLFDGVEALQQILAGPAEATPRAG